MAAITGTKVVNTEFAGTNKIVVLSAPIGSASDTITVSESDHGISDISALIGVQITGGLDAAFSYVQASATSTVITLTSFEQDGTAATDFTGTTVNVTVIGS